MRRLLVSDIDGTLVGDPAATRRLRDVLASRRDRILLAYATGRTLTQCRDLIDDADVPAPDVWITEVGAAITFQDAGVDEGWQARMREHWHRETVKRLADAWPELTPQPAIADGPFKVPYRIAPADAAVVLPQLSMQLREAGTPAHLIYSSARDLDIVPAAAGKGPAVLHVANRLGVPLEHVLTAGDSANDQDMLTLGGPAVRVANAHAELVVPATVLQAKATFADGVVEALGHYGWL
jgi:sucrose-phosphate synthase